MLLYNITFATESKLEDEIVAWLRSEFVPAATVDDNEYFSSPEIFKVVSRTEPGTTSLAVHLRAQSVDDINRWYADHGSRLFAALMARYNDRVVYFPTVLEAL